MQLLRWYKFSSLNLFLKNTPIELRNSKTKRVKHGTESQKSKVPATNNLCDFRQVTRFTLQPQEWRCYCLSPKSYPVLMFNDHIIFWMFHLYHNNNMNRNSINDYNNNKMREALMNSLKNTALGVRQCMF